MDLRIKLRKNQSTIASEQIQQEKENITTLEILGESIEKLPPLNQLSSCHTLALNCPQLTELPPLPPAVLTLKIRGGHFKISPQQFTSLTQLKTLTLNNHFNIPEQLELPATVEVLDLSGNKLSSLPKHLFTRKVFKRLTFDRNELTHLPEELYNLTTLNHLSLDQNPLNEETINRLHHVFGLWF